MTPLNIRIKYLLSHRYFLLEKILQKNIKYENYNIITTFIYHNMNIINKFKLEITYFFVLKNNKKYK